jgi:hypothetical protein
MALSAICRNSLAIRNCSLLKLLLGAEVRVERAMRQAGGLQAWLSNFPETKGL